MKRPSFQFYPSDWLRDTALRSCSTGARGLWIDMICFMHEGKPYGHLKVGDKVILPANLGRMVGETLDVVEGWLAELKDAGVYEVAEDGSICSKRMIRDENLRQIRAAGGSKGGNPALKDMGKVNLKVIQEDKQKPTPSSSSSSSSSSNTNTRFAEFWSTYPNCKRKGSKSKCDDVWSKRGYDGIADQILGHLESMATSDDWTKMDGQFVPAPLVYLNKQSWDGWSSSSPVDQPVKNWF